MTQVWHCATLIDKWVSCSLWFQEWIKPCWSLPVLAMIIWYHSVGEMDQNRVSQGKQNESRSKSNYQWLGIAVSEFVSLLCQHSSLYNPNFLFEEVSGYAAMLLLCSIKPCITSWKVLMELRNVGGQPIFGKIFNSPWNNHTGTWYVGTSAKQEQPKLAAGILLVFSEYSWMHKCMWWNVVLGTFDSGAYDHDGGSDFKVSYVSMELPTLQKT